MKITDEKKVCKVCGGDPGRYDFDPQGCSCTRPAANSRNMLHLAVAAVLEADTEFREQMMPGWEGDPLSDEIDGLRRVFTAALAEQTQQGVEEPVACFAWNEGIDTAPYSTTVLATYFDMDVGEWIVKIFAAERPTAPFTHWMWFASPGEAAELPWRNMSGAPRTGEEFIARVGASYPAFSCFWDGEAFVHYDKDDGFINYPVAEWLPMPVAASVQPSIDAPPALVDVPAVESEPVALIEREVLAELQKHWSATGTVCSPLFKSKFGGKVPLYAHPPRSLSNEGDNMLRLAVEAVLEADTEFRAQMMPGWEGDPLSDEIDGLRRVFTALSTRKGSAGDGSATGASGGVNA